MIGKETIPAGMDPILKGTIFLAKLRQEGETAHRAKVRYANMVIRLLEATIRKEVIEATGKSRDDPDRMTWDEVGKLLGISKSAAFARYGGDN